MENRFYFTASDLARFLGKAPTTIRKWDAGGFVKIPRDSGGDRKVSMDDVVVIAKRAQAAKRISLKRLQLIEEAATTLSIIESENHGRS